MYFGILQNSKMNRENPNNKQKFRKNTRKSDKVEIRKYPKEYKRIQLNFERIGNQDNVRESGKIWTNPRENLEIWRNQKEYEGMWEDPTKFREDRKESEITPANTRESGQKLREDRKESGIIKKKPRESERIWKNPLQSKRM